MTEPRTPEDLDAILDQALEESFPASDPPAIVQPQDPDGDPEEDDGDGA